MIARDPTSPALRMTVAAGPEIGKRGRLPLDRTVRMVKSALLYADTVTLCSPVSSLLFSFLSLDFLNETERLWFIREMVESTVAFHLDPTQRAQVEFALETYEQLRLRRVRRQRRSREELIIEQRFAKLLGNTFEQMRDVLVGLFEDSGARDLLPAIEANLLELHQFKAGDLDGMSDEFIEIALHMVSNRTAYPLLDDSVSGLVRAGINEGIIATSAQGLERSKQVALAALLLQWLPSFDDVPVDELLDIRRELDEPLQRFRSAIIRFTDSVESAPWDDDFILEAEMVYRRDVLPAVMEIEAAVEANRYLRRLKEKASAPVGALTGGGITMVLSRLGELPGAVHQSLAAQAVGSGVIASGAGLGVKALWDAHSEWRSGLDEIERNHIYFYYKAGKATEKW